MAKCNDIWQQHLHLTEAYYFLNVCLAGSRMCQTVLALSLIMVVISSNGFEFALLHTTGYRLHADITRLIERDRAGGRHPKAAKQLSHQGAAHLIACSRLQRIKRPGAGQEKKKKSMKSSHLARAQTGVWREKRIGPHLGSKYVCLGRCRAKEDKLAY